NPRAAIPTPPADALATLNTHDTPPFASFWRGSDIKERLGRGWLRPEEAAHEQAERAALREALIEYLRTRGWLGATGPLAPLAPQTEAAVLRACLAPLADSPAALGIAGLEDLWTATRRLNAPARPA